MKRLASASKFLFLCLVPHLAEKEAHGGGVARQGVGGSVTVLQSGNVRKDVASSVSDDQQEER